MTVYMLRDYRVKPGEMCEWIEEWARVVYPIRLKFGFKVLGAWRIGDERFVWVLCHDGKKEDFEKADEGYHNSKERKGAKPDPARHLVETKHWVMEDVMPPD